MDAVYFQTAVDKVNQATAIYAQALDDFIVAMQNLKSQVQDNPVANYPGYVRPNLAALEPQNTYKPTDLITVTGPQPAVGE